MGIDWEDKKGPPVSGCKDSIQQKVVIDVLRERGRQDTKWGPEHDRNEETETNWIAYIQEYTSGAGRGAKYDFRQRMIITAALAIAAVEALDANRAATEDAGANTNVPG